MTFRPIEISTPIEWQALRLWRAREVGWPAFVRRDPDELDLATGAWARSLRAAELGLSEIR